MKKLNLFRRFTSISENGCLNDEPQNTKTQKAMLRGAHFQHEKNILRNIASQRKYNLHQTRTRICVHLYIPPDC